MDGDNKSEQEADNCLYKYSIGLSTLQEKLFSVNKEVDQLNQKKREDKEFAELSQVERVYDTVFCLLDKFFETKSEELTKMREMANTTENSLPLPWTCYEDVINLADDIKKLKEVLEDPGVYIGDTEEELRSYLGKLQKVVLDLDLQVTECEELLQNSKMFVNNISTLIANNEDKDKSDLGCYPHEKSPESREEHELEFTQVKKIKTLENTFSDFIC